MASITAIELGADTCALARTSVRGADVRVYAVETLDPGRFTGLDSFTGAVKQARRALKLPHRARVVLWGLPEGSTGKDAAVKPLLAPLVGAGFTVERVVSPCEALAALARVRAPRTEGATCWLAINRGGVAIVVIRPGKQLYSHSFVWDSTVGSSGSQARLLQRYSLVSFLSPEVRRAMAEARKQGTPVDAVVTCGNLPDLRSLTMPLIEELDVEVETLDSLDGLIVKPPVTDRIAEAAPAIRLACAGTVARGARPWDEAKRGAARRAAAVFRAAAILVGAAAIGFAWYAARGSRLDLAALIGRKGTPATKPVSPTPKPAAPAPKPSGAASASSPSAKPAAVSTPPIAHQQGGLKPTTSGSPNAQLPRAPKAAPAPARVPVPAPQHAPQQTTRSSSRILPAGPPVSAISAPPPPSRPEPRTVDPAPRSPLPLHAPAVRADKPDAVTRASTTPREAGLPPLLKDPLPRVTAILVANDRRFATINEGQIIGIGDVLGRRIVIGIEDRAVVLREPSGVQIRVGLGGQLLGAERGR